MLCTFQKAHFSSVITRECPKNLDGADHYSTGTSSLLYLLQRQTLRRSLRRNGTAIVAQDSFCPVAAMSSASPLSHLCVYCEAVGRTAVWECSSEEGLASVILLCFSVVSHVCVMCHLSESFPKKNDKKTHVSCHDTLSLPVRKLFLCCVSLQFEEVITHAMSPFLMNISISDYSICLSEM